MKLLNCKNQIFSTTWFSHVFFTFFLKTIQNTQHNRNKKLQQKLTWDRSSLCSCAACTVPVCPKFAWKKWTERAELCHWKNYTHLAFCQQSSVSATRRLFNHLAASFGASQPWFSRHGLIHRISSWSSWTGQIIIFPKHWKFNRLHWQVFILKLYHIQ